MTSASIPEQPVAVDRRQTTPPKMSEYFKYIRSKIPLSQRSDQTHLVNPNNPKLYVVHTHGSSLRETVPVKVPIVCGVKDGESHLRVTVSYDDAQEKTVNLSMVDLMNHNMQLVQEEEKAMGKYSSLLEQVFEAARMLVADGKTMSLPVKYDTGQQMEDIKIFCRGRSMHDGIYAIDLVTHDIQAVAKVFGLDVKPEADRKPTGPSKNLNSKYRLVLWREYDEIKALKTQLLNQPKISEQEYHRYARRVKMYNNMILNGKGVKKLSRITDSTKQCISLSGLIQKGISKGIIDPSKDCFIVFTCRSHHDDRSPSPHPPLPPPLPPSYSHQPPLPPSSHNPSSSRQHSRPQSTDHDHQPSKLHRPGEGGTRKTSRKLNKKTRRVKMRRNKTKSRTRKY